MALPGHVVFDELLRVLGSASTPAHASKQVGRRLARRRLGLVMLAVAPLMLVQPLLGWLAWFHFGDIAAAFADSGGFLVLDPEVFDRVRRFSLAVSGVLAGLVLIVSLLAFSLARRMNGAVERLHGALRQGCGDGTGSCGAGACEPLRARLLRILEEER